MSAFLSKVCDVGDLPVQVLSFGFGNWVLEAQWLSGLWNCRLRRPTFFYVFYVFSDFKKTRLFTFFELLHTFSRTLIHGLLHSNYWIHYSVIYEPIEFQIPASACGSILHISHSFQKQKKRTKHYCTRHIESGSNSDWQMTFIEILKKRLEN